MKKSIKTFLAFCEVVMVSFMISCGGDDDNSYEKNFIGLQKIDNILYFLNVPEHTAEIRDGKELSGMVSLPSSVVFGGETCIVNSIGSRAFYGNANITSIIVPNSVTSIGKTVFKECSNLKSVSIGDGLEIIEEGAFTGCTQLESITIPNSVELLGKNAFESCTALKSVTLGNGLKSIKEYAFVECTQLESIAIPDNVTELGEGIFVYCSSLNSVTIGKGVTSIPEKMFDFCPKLTSVSISDNVVYIGMEAFANCESLKSITIPDNVSDVDIYAFAGCSSLTTIVLGKNISRIDDTIFAGCKLIKDVYCYAAVVPDVPKVGYFIENRDATLHVPAALLDLYKNSIFGLNFKNIVAIEE